jgi:hypothetical protein
MGITDSTCSIPMANYNIARVNLEAPKMASGGLSDDTSQSTQPFAQSVSATRLRKRATEIHSAYTRFGDRSCFRALTHWTTEVRIESVQLSFAKAGTPWSRLIERGIGSVGRISSQSPPAALLASATLSGAAGARNFSTVWLRRLHALEQLFSQRAN